MGSSPTAKPQAIHRAGLDPVCQLQLSRHADLKTRAEGAILVLPEQAIRLGGSGGEILRLVLEGGTAAAILATMRSRYPESIDLDVSVQQFLERMLEIGGIVKVDSSGVKLP